MAPSFARIMGGVRCVSTKDAPSTHGATRSFASSMVAASAVRTRIATKPRRETRSTVSRMEGAAVVHILGVLAPQWAKQGDVFLMGAESVASMKAVHMLQQTTGACVV
mmetsp:Transcript_31763/g.61187  ORF Transcript_31763/g.61187 Transcript_31763/m.61187 type:complete len:108 (-) Transcript_31763:392-715(-)